LPTSMWAFSLPNKNSTWMMEPLISFSSTLMSPYWHHQTLKLCFSFYFSFLSLSVSLFKLFFIKKTLNLCFFMSLSWCSNVKSLKKIKKIIILMDDDNSQWCPCTFRWRI
jgi:hypothetical protein